MSRRESWASWSCVARNSCWATGSRPMRPTPCCATAGTGRGTWYESTRRAIYVVDRRKEMMKYKGFSIAPAEVESVLLEHPGVRDCGVVSRIETEATRRRAPSSSCARANWKPSEAAKHAGVHGRTHGELQGTARNPFRGQHPANRIRKDPAPGAAQAVVGGRFLALGFGSWLRLLGFSLLLFPKLTVAGWPFFAAPAQSSLKMVSRLVQLFAPSGCRARLRRLGLRNCVMSSAGRTPSWDTGERTDSKKRGARRLPESDQFQLRLEVVLQHQHDVDADGW